MAFDDTLVFKNLCVLLAALDDEALFQAHFKHAFMSVVRSFLCEADEDSIARQVMQLPRYSRDLKVKVLPEFEAFFNTLYGVRDVMEERTLEALLHALIEAFSFREKVLKLPRAHLALYRIDYLLSLSESMSNEGMHIHEFVAMLITMLDQGLDLEINESKPLSLDTVHLMTIHKSKGLEFPFVYFPHLYKPFNKSKMRNYDFDRRLGILQLHEDEGLEKSFLYPLLSLMEKEESMSELMRVLYVALSRAKEGFSLYLGLDASKDKSYRVDEDDKIIKHERLKYPNFESVFKSVLDRLAPYVHTLEFEHLAMDLDYLKTQSKQSINVPQEEKVYAHIDDLEEVCEQKTLSHGVETLLESSSQENLALGDRIHQLLEWIDFFKPLDEEIKQYTHDAFEAKLVQNFFNQPFMQSLKLINVYKEFPFVKEDSGSVIKGYIDCLLETEDKFIVVDYKLKDIENPVYLDQVRGYIEVIKERTKKEVQGVLYSLLEGRFKDVTLLP